MNKKKTVILALAGLLSAGAFSGVMMNEMGGIANVFANDNADAVVWKHYAAVAPTFTSHGSKEFWANCSNLGVHQFEAPAKGTIEEGGDFSLTTYFKELTAEDDRYVAKLTPKVTFDSRGGTVIESQDVEYNALATEPTAPTREADGYYDSYTFDGWYMNGEKFDFTKPVTGNVDLIAKWKGEGQKYEEVKLTSGTSTNVTSTHSKGITVRNLDFTFSQLAWSGNKVDDEKKADLIAKFGGTERDNDGVFISPGKTGSQTVEKMNVTFPKIDFVTMLQGGKVMTMELGGYQNGCAVFINGETLFSNSGANIAYMNRAKAYFYLEGGSVKLRAVGLNNPANDVYSCKEISYTLSEEESNGTVGLAIDIGADSYTRNYWIGNPRIIKGEYNVLDFSAKENVTVENGILKTRTERDAESGAPFTQWKETAALSFDGIGVAGNGSNPLVVNYGTIDMNAIFAKGEGLRFTLGAWNGGEKLTYEGRDFGVSGQKPDNPTNNTADSIVDTWKNFQIEITKAGMSVFNHYEKKEYTVGIPEEVLGGKKDLVFNIGSRSNGHFFYISNVKAFHA